MQYTVFKNIYEEMHNYADINSFIKAYGWHNWMEEYCTDNDDTVINKILFEIYEIRSLPYKELRNHYGISNLQLSKDLSLSQRTLQQWGAGSREPTNYLFLVYIMFTEYFLYPKIKDVGIEQ